MITVHQVPIDFSSVPQAAAIQTAIDGFLSVPAWGINEMQRTHVLNWTNFGGITVAKARALAAMLLVYRDFGGWNVTTENTSDTSWTIVFRRYWS